MLYPFELRALGVPRLFYPQSELSQTGSTERTAEIGYCRGKKDGGRYRIRTYDFHRVKMALYR